MKYIVAFVLLMFLVVFPIKKHYDDGKGYKYRISVDGYFLDGFCNVIKEENGCITLVDSLGEDGKYCAGYSVLKQK